MADNRVDIVVDDKAARRAIGRLLDAVADPRAALDEIGSRLVASTLARFEREAAPDGTPWRKSLRAIATGGQTLQDFGTLKGSITHVVAGDGVDVGSIGESEFTDGKGATYTRYYNGGAGANAGSSTVTLAGGAVVTARGGAGGARAFFDHNALGQPSGNGVPYSFGYYGRVRYEGGRNGQAGERVSWRIVAGDTPIQIDLAPGGAGGRGATGNQTSGANGVRGSDAQLLIYPLPP